jgi:hypothetical protein
MNKSPNGGCHFCKDPENLMHPFVNCKLVDSVWREIFQKINEQNEILIIVFFWYLATFRSFQIIHFVVVKIALTIALIWSSLWLIPKIIEFSDFDIVLISFCS